MPGRSFQGYQRLFGLCAMLGRQVLIVDSPDVGCFLQPLSSECALWEREQYLHVQQRLHGPGWRTVRSVRCGQVQGDGWVGRV